MARKLSVDSAVFLAGFTAILYTWSTAHYNGFLWMLRLDTNMMERSFHQVIYSGLLISFVPALLVLVAMAFILYMYSHAILPIYIDWIRSSVGSKRRAIKFRRFWFGKRNSPPIELRAKMLFADLAVMALFGAIYIATLAYFEHKGREKAKSLIENHFSGKNKPSQLVKVTINKRELDLLFVGCGSRNCAGIEEASNIVFYYASSSGYSFVHQGTNVAKVSN